MIKFLRADFRYFWELLNFQPFLSFDYIIINRKRFFFQNGITSLHVAAKRGHADFCAFLLDRHARLDICTRDQLTPLHCAARSGHSPVVKLFLKVRQAPKFAKTKVRATALV